MSLGSMPKYIRTVPMKTIAPNKTTASRETMMVMILRVDTMLELLWFDAKERHSEVARRGFRISQISHEFQ